jgi:hypothetical protein
MKVSKTETLSSLARTRGTGPVTAETLDPENLEPRETQMCSRKILTVPVRKKGKVQLTYILSECNKNPAMYIFSI